MKKNDTYYVMVEPTSKSKDEFNPFVLEYGLPYEKANLIMRKFVMEHGLWVRIKGKKLPARIHIYRTSETLPENYFVVHSLLGVKV